MAELRQCGFCDRPAVWRSDEEDHPVYLCNFHAEPLTASTATIRKPADGGLMLTVTETLDLIDAMANRAEQDADPDRDDGFWDGWAGGLRTLAQHMRTGVKATCFPQGSCACHPLPLSTATCEMRTK